MLLLLWKKYNTRNFIVNITTYILLFFRETDMVVVDRVMPHLFDHIEEEELYQTAQ